MKRITSTYKQYRAAVHEAYTRNMCNPSVHWHADCGYYACPDARLIPLNEGEAEIGTAYYHASSGEASLSGSRREYSRVRLALRLWLAGLAGSYEEAHIEVATAYDHPEDSNVYDPIAELHSQLTRAQTAGGER